MTTGDEFVPFAEVRPLLDQLFEKHGHLCGESSTAYHESHPHVFTQSFCYEDPEFKLDGEYAVEMWSNPLTARPPRIMFDFKITYVRGSITCRANGACPVPRWVVEKIRAKLVLETLAGL